MAGLLKIPLAAITPEVEKGQIVPNED